MDILGRSKDNHKHNKEKKDMIKLVATIPMVGAIVTAAILLSGLSLIGSFQQPAIAQQENMTGGAAAGNATNATMTGGAAAGNATNATMTGGAAGNPPINSSPSADSLTGGTPTGDGATVGGGEASGGVPGTTGGAAGSQVRP